MVSQRDVVSDACPSGTLQTVFPPEQVGAQPQSLRPTIACLPMTDYQLEPILPLLSEDPYMLQTVARAVNHSDFSLSTDDFRDPLALATAQLYSAPGDSRSVRAPDTPRDTPHSNRLDGVFMMSSINAKAQGDDHLFRSERSLRVVGSEAQIKASLRRRRPGRGPDPAHRRCVRCGRSFTRNKNFRGESQSTCILARSSCPRPPSRHENRRNYACTAHGRLARFNTAGDRVSHLHKIHLKTRRDEQKRR
ncbi:hypothetical protein EV122DRAFT_290512 [Schizophyllum commune]